MQVNFTPRGKELNASNYKTLAKAAELQLDAPTKSFSASLGNVRQSTAEIFANEDVLPKHILKAHIQETRDRCYESDCEVIVVGMDQCDYSMHNHVAMVGLVPDPKPKPASKAKEVAIKQDNSSRSKPKPKTRCRSKQNSISKSNRSNSSNRSCTKAKPCSKSRYKSTRKFRAKKKSSLAFKADVKALSASVKNKSKPSKRVLGIHQQSAICVSENKEFFGVLYQNMWVTNGKGSEVFGEGKESQKWKLGFDAVQKTFGQQLPKHKKIALVVTDREGDEFGYLSSKRNKGVELLSRVFQDRYYEIIDDQNESEQNVTEGPVFQKLSVIKDNMPKVGEKTIEFVQEGVGYIVELDIFACKVRMKSPERSGDQDGIDNLTLIIARERSRVIKNQAIYDKRLVERRRTSRNTKKSFEPEQVEWILLTTLELTKKMTAIRIVNMYSLRWMIERFHYYTKTGIFNMEKKQFQNVHTFMNALAFYGVLTWRMMALKDTFILRPEDNVNTIFDENEVKILEAYTDNKVDKVKDAEKALMNMVKFSPSKKQPHMGAKKLADATEKLANIKEYERNLRNHRKKATG
jgi:hypothetical protein